MDISDPKEAVLINTLLEQLYALIPQDLLIQNDFTSGFLTGFSVVLMLFTCFFGYRLNKLFITVSGALIGLLLGGAIGAIVFQNGIAAIIASLTLAVVIGLLAFKLYRAGVFLWVVFLTFPTLCDLLAAPLGSYTQSLPLLLPLIGVAAAILLGLLTLRFMRPLIICITAVSGGFSAAINLCAIGATFFYYSAADQTVQLITLLCGLALMVLGMIVQFKGKKKL